MYYVTSSRTADHNVMGIQCITRVVHPNKTYHKLFEVYARLPTPDHDEHGHACEYGVQALGATTGARERWLAVEIDSLAKLSPPGVGLRE